MQGNFWEAAEPLPKGYYSRTHWPLSLLSDRVSKKIVTGTTNKRPLINWKDVLDGGCHCDEIPLNIVRDVLTKGYFKDKPNDSKRQTLKQKVLQLETVIEAIEEEY